MFSHILVAIDLDHKETWQKMFTEAIAYASQEGSVLHVMTVVPDFGTSLVGSFFPKDHKEKMISQTNEKLHKIVSDNIPSGIKVQHIVGYGNAYEEILRMQKKLSCDLIIIGSHRPHMKDYLLGPNAARVVRHANCSVLVIRD
ncbi:universal stress protein [Sneathiella glossodoripedis]|uniref:universal stress protein n=1 Tax=Sneathiella glossodoripedis TaxID=418853 RepID=UPI00046F458B|nr:universal stress protein [Sneathiella glossodoripedis]